MQIRQYNYGKASVLLLGVMLVALLFPICTESATAEEAETRTAGPSSVAISLQPALSVEVKPSQEGAFAASEAILKVKVSNASQYTIFLNTGDGSNFLRSNTVTNYAAIKPVAAETTVANFPRNSWGYSLELAGTTDERLYAPAPKAMTLVQTKPVASASTYVDSWVLSLGAKLDTNIPADTYRNSLVVSVLADPIVITDMGSITYMQQMTPEICANSELEKEYTLIDSRDDNTYTVRKLKDDNCWMTQNLALTGGRTLIPNDSDLTWDWTMPATYVSITIESTADINSMLIRSWNNGNGYGTYYTFNAAVAGNSGSVCPKGWQLPKAGNTYNSSSGSFYYLFNRYGATVSNSVSSGILQATPLNLVFGGGISVGSNGVGIDYVNTHGYYWSSVSDTSSNAYLFTFDSNNNLPSYSYYRRCGLSVRCLAR